MPKTVARSSLCSRALSVCNTKSDLSSGASLSRGISPAVALRKHCALLLWNGFLKGFLQFHQSRRDRFHVAGSQFGALHVVHGAATACYNTRKYALSSSIILN